MKKLSGTTKKIFISCAAVLVALAIALTVVVGLMNGMLLQFFGGGAMPAAAMAEGEELATRIEEEGIVMVKNDGGALPLVNEDVKKETSNEYRVNVFGWAATDWLAGGSGSGRAVRVNGDSHPDTDLLKALNEYTYFDDNGVQYNNELIQIYKNFKNGRANAANDTLHSFPENSCVLYEPAKTVYTDTVMQNATQYSSTALVVLGRISGESNDAPKVQYKYGLETDNERTYLDISEEEEDMLKLVVDKFDKVVVIINSTNTMNLGFLDSIAGIDACLIVGGTGTNAANAIPNILFGKKLEKVVKTDDDGQPEKDDDGNIVYEKDDDGNVITEWVDCSPSGRLVDTQVLDFKSNPTYAYSGEAGCSYYTGISRSNNIYPYDNSTKNPNVGTDPLYDGVSYLDYVESIYVGYKWYETAFADKIKLEYGGKTYDYSTEENYRKIVQYPFGYGMSYTSFDWEVLGWDVADGKITVSVRVTNTGTVAGQEVVQLYYTPTYQQGGLEKAAVNLLAEAKTPTALKPDPEGNGNGESGILILEGYIQDMASYDAYEGDGAFVLEGNCTLSLRTDAHTVATVKSGSATYVYNNNRTVYNDYYGSNGTEKIRNLFTGDDISDVVAVDGSNLSSMQGLQSELWLSRADFAGTFKSEKLAPRAWDNDLLASNRYDQAEANAWDAAWEEEHPEISDDFTQESGGDIRLYENGEFTEFAYFYGNPDNYDDEDAWTELIDQMSWAEMRNLVLHGYTKELAVPSIGKPLTASFDGPSQYASFNTEGVGTGFPMPTVLAQSWNPELAENFGYSCGGDAFRTSTSASNRNGWYAPGSNLHRSAFGGRNYEYYSEDSYLSGIMCAAVVRGALNVGVYTYIKHVIGYDQESFRDGLYCWMTEQALRETYLSPFKRAVDAGASGLMSSYGRIGSRWSGGSEALLTDLLRNEWGFKGTVITDYSDHRDFMNGDEMLRTGGDLWMDGWSASGNGPGAFRYTTDSTAAKYMLRNASKNIIYTYCNAAYEAQQYQLNGGEPGVDRGNGNVFMWWWLIVALVDVAFLAGAAVLLFFALKPVKATEGGAPAEANGNAPADGGASPEANAESEANPAPDEGGKGSFFDDDDD